MVNLAIRYSCLKKMRADWEEKPGQRKKRLDQMIAISNFDTFMSSYSNLQLDQLQE